MRKLVLISLFASVLFSVGLACISIPSADLFSEPECVLVNESTATSLHECSLFYFDSLNLNKTEAIEQLQAFRNYTCLASNDTPGWSECVTGTVDCFGGECAKWVYVRTSQLSDEDIEIIADFLSNGYSVIKQTNEEYAAFLEHALLVNENLSTCDYYLAVAHKGDWTGFVFTRFSDKTEECASMPRPACAPVTVNLLWNDLGNYSKDSSENPETPSSNTNLAFLVALALLLIAVLVVLLRKR